MNEFDDIKKQFKEVEKKLSDPSIISDPQKLGTISKEHASLKKLHDLILRLEEIEKTITDNSGLINSDEDEELKKIAQEENEELKGELSELEEQINEELFPDDPNDKKNVIIEIRAGAGGDESALFTGELFRMYLKFSEEKGWKSELLSSHPIGIGGYKEVIFSISGEKVYAYLKFEAGTHRVQRVPETEKQGRVHTSTSTVIVLPEAEEIDITIDPADIRIDTFCSSGPGGQSVNTTHSAIRITHLPTGMVVSCQDEKSQHQNKEKALQILRSRLLAKAEEERALEESSSRKSQVGRGDRSDKIRTYNFPQSRITDHRINTSWHNIDEVIDGKLDEIIETLRKAQREENKNDR